MKILLLTDAANVHTRKWANYLHQQGVDVEILSLMDAEIEGVKVHTFKSSAYERRKNSVSYNRTAVFKDVLPQIRKRIKEIQPDILHSHYVSSFGLFGAVSGFHPFIVSAWGSDITDFPYKSAVNRLIVKHVLKKADVICVSSRYLIDETAKFTSKKPELVYFGTDFETFKPDCEERGTVLSTHFPMLDAHLNKEKVFVFGTVKGLFPHYGVNNLIEAAAIFADNTVNEDLKWELWIGGDGISKEELQSLAKQKGIAERVKFLGRIPYDDMPELLNKMDVFVVPSLRESFGVVAVEASACCKPVIVTNTGGLPETIAAGKTGCCVQAGNPQAIAGELLMLYKDKELRQKMGLAGREYVRERFCWKENAAKMMNIYQQVYDTYKKKR